MCLLSAAGTAQERGGDAAPVRLPEISVAPATPVPGSDVEADRLPFHARALTGADLSASGPPSLLRGLDERVGAITLSDAQSNPFQPNLTYRGFQASPLGGNPQGLAVYLNGARFNQPFGDTVQFDLIPDVAIDRVTLEGPNPAFGLNALGGALALTLKNGFTYQGTELRSSAGAFGRISTSLEHGARSGGAAAYLAATGLSEDGWRSRSPSRLRQIFGDLGWRGDGGELHVNLVGARNGLTGNGASPVELLASSRRAPFTYPDRTENGFARLGVSGAVELAPTLSVQANAYVGGYRQRTANGDAADALPCADRSLLCTADGQNLLDAAGASLHNDLRNSPFASIPAFATRFAGGGPYGQLNTTGTDSLAVGGSIQAVQSAPLGDRPNRLALGVSYDGGDTAFRAASLLGALTPDRGFAGPGTAFALPDRSLTPVSLKSRNGTVGLFASDTAQVTDALAITGSARLNVARIDLRDQIGTALTGRHDYARLNPSLGLTYRLSPAATLHAGYSEANRTPSPAELACADPAAPCGLTNFFVGDPHLKQVVARTVEIGLRGTAQAAEEVTVAWKAGLFRANSADDIQLVASSTPGRAYFRKLGETRRQGVEAGLSLTAGAFSAFVDYALTDATFRTSLTLNSPLNPFAMPAGPANDDAGVVQVRPGNRLPGVPRHALKAGLKLAPGERWTLGLTVRSASGQYLAGDPSNLNRQTAAYAVLNLFASWQVTPNMQVFGTVDNALNARYATFGTFSPVGLVPVVQAPSATLTRSLSVGPPLAASGGVRVVF